MTTSTYNAHYLSVRARALSSFLTPFGGNIGSIFVGWWLDSKFLNRRKRAIYAFSGIIILYACLSSEFPPFVLT